MRADPMPRWMLLLVSISGTLCCGGFEPAPPAGDAPENLGDLEQALVDAHNAARASAQPAPSPALPLMTWSTPAADTAQTWAQRCVFEHSTSTFGENLAVFSPRDIGPALATTTVELWDSERADYDYDDNSCRAGAQCGHYTQIVWRDSTAVGCGVAECDDVPGFGPGSLWVCNYDPPGNFIGERPY
jgi:pathogenesis-related protein 1